MMQLETVPQVDLARYQGKWYEIARLPLFWENKCASDVTAEYRLKQNGSIEVLNSCRKSDGRMTQSRGTALPDRKDTSNSKLKVTFFWPFTASYWILALDDNYQWALVGTPDRKHLWILSRTPALNPDTVSHLLERARKLNFPTNKVIFTKHHGA